uniref:EamA domain-containing protein n=1 Tax=Fagus sylvatica TaxID=28930 RepID=A0A2N9GK68_FAGSY
MTLKSTNRVTRIGHTIRTVEFWSAIVWICVRTPTPTFTVDASLSNDHCSNSFSALTKNGESPPSPTPRNLREEEALRPRMASTEAVDQDGDGDHEVELIVRDASPSPLLDAVVSEEIAPLLIQAQTQKPKINIFTLSYPRTKTREQVTRLPESETSSVTQFILWVWSGSRYSGFLCMAISSIIYFLMELLSDVFSGLACSFFGVLFIYRQMLTTQGGLVKAGEANNTHPSGSHHIYLVLVGLFSSITGGVSYCLIRAGAKASDQPVVTVFSFGILASPAAGICTFSFEDFVLPGLHSFLLMLVLGVLAFFAEVFLARGLQLEKTSKAANVQYIEAAMSQLWSIGSLRIAPSFGRFVGCLLILISVCYTMYMGPDKEME